MNPFHFANRLHDPRRVKRESVSARSASALGVPLSERMIAIRIVGSFIRFSPLATTPQSAATGRGYLLQAQSLSGLFSASLIQRGMSAARSVLFGARKRSVAQKFFTSNPVSIKPSNSTGWFLIWCSRVNTPSISLRPVGSNADAVSVRDSVGTDGAHLDTYNHAHSALFRHFEILRGQVDARVCPSPSAGESNLVPLPKCPVVMAFVTFAICLPTMCLFVWLVYSGLTH